MSPANPGKPGKPFRGKPGRGRGDDARPARSSRTPRIGGGLRLIYEDEHLLVIDKPPGVLSSSVPGQDADNAFDFVKEHVRSNRGRRGGPAAWIIHRLDREASGLLVFAKNHDAFTWLKEDLRAKRIQRLYTAVVEGQMTPDTPDGLGVVQSYIADTRSRVVKSSQRPTKRDDDSGDDDAKPAVTYYHIAATGRGNTLLRLKLDTGRKNQIRIHCKDLNHPIVGDRRYGAVSDPIDRICLHATDLWFTHPANGQLLHFQSTPPPRFLAICGLDPARGLPPIPDNWQPGGAAAAEDTPTNPEAPVRGKQQRPAADTSWDHVAGWYDQLLEEKRSDHHERTIVPGAMRLLHPSAADRILDVACGQGLFCQRLAPLVHQVHGVDAAPRLIAAAEQHVKKSRLRNVRFTAGDARALSTLDLGNEPFTKATCLMALMNIDPLAPTLRGIADRLAPGGALVAVILHPAFRSPGQTSWGWDESAQGEQRGQQQDRRGRGKPGSQRSTPNPQQSVRQYRRVDGYLSNGQSEIVMNPGEVAGGQAPTTTYTFHRPIQSYIKALAEAGFMVDALEEWPSSRTSQPGPRAAEENRARREIPMFLAFRAIRK